MLVGTVMPDEVELRISVGVPSWSGLRAAYHSMVKTEGWQVRLLYIHLMVVFIEPMHTDVRRLQDITL